jgi:hypothetical protein
MIHHQLQPLIEAPITDLKAQKKYMIENIQYMNKEIKSLILHIVIVNIDNLAGEDVPVDDAIDEALSNGILIQNHKGTKGLNIDLDKLDEDVIRQIYNIIYNRMEILNTPVRQRTYPIFNFSETN